MGIYFKIFKFNLYKYLAYPTEGLAVVVRKILEIGLLMVFWSAVASSNPEGNYDVKTLIAYFLIAGGVAELTMVNTVRFSKTIITSIKTGDISNFIIKPVNTIYFMYFSTIGSMGINAILSIISIFLGITLTANITIFSILSFIIFFSLALLLSFYFNLMLGIVGFYVVDPHGIRMLVRHLGKLLSGMLVPLYFFPDIIRFIANLTPFPPMLFGPIDSLKYTGFNEQMLKAMGISLVWIITFAVLSKFLWNKSIKNYEAIGI